PVVLHTSLLLAMDHSSPFSFLRFPSSLLLLPPPPTSTLFPYTTLFRSWHDIFQYHIQSIACCLGLLRISPVADSFFWHIVQKNRSEEHTSELQSRENLVCRLLLEKKKKHRPRQRAPRPQGHFIADGCP